MIGMAKRLDKSKKPYSLNIAKSLQSPVKDSADSSKSQSVSPVVSTPVFIDTASSDQPYIRHLSTHPSNNELDSPISSTSPSSLPARLPKKSYPTIPTPSLFRSRVSFDTFEKETESTSFSLNKKHRNYEYSRRSRTFLCGLDSNDYSEYALEWLMEELVQDGDEVVCLRVVEKDSRIITPGNMNQRHYREQAETLMNSIQAKNPRNKVINIVVEFAVGKVQDVIGDMITLYQPAILVVGTRGRSLNGIMGLLPGSVSKYCLQHSPVPVIVVRPNAQRTLSKQKRLENASRRAYRDLLDRCEYRGLHPLEMHRRRSSLAEMLVGQPSDTTNDSPVNSQIRFPETPRVIPPTPLHQSPRLVRTLSTPQAGKLATPNASQIPVSGKRSLSFSFDVADGRANMIDEKTPRQTSATSNYPDNIQNETRSPISCTRTHTNVGVNTNFTSDMHSIKSYDAASLSPTAMVATPVATPHSTPTDENNPLNGGYANYTHHNLNESNVSFNHGPPRVKINVTTLPTDKSPSSLQSASPDTLLSMNSTVTAATPTSNTSGLRTRSPAKSNNLDVPSQNEES